MKTRLLPSFTSALFGSTIAQPLRLDLATERMRKCVPTAWILPLLLSIFPVAIQAQSQFTYTINSDLTITITGYTGSSNVVAIPGTIQGLPVTAIGPSAFAGNSSLASITIPDSVISIGVGAFYQDIGLTNAVVGDGVITIEDSLSGRGVFEQCRSLANVKFGNKVANIGARAFISCGMAAVTLPNTLTNIGSYAFFYCTNLTAVTMGNNLTSIMGYAFQDCCNLLSFTVPDSVASLGYGVFSSCSSLTNMTIGNGLTSIGANTSIFYGCNNLTNMTIGSGVTNIGANAFLGCGSLLAINIDTNNTYYSSLDGVLFDKNRSTLVEYPFGRSGNYTIPDGVTRIADKAFSGCVNLTSVSISDSVISIGNSAFQGCSSLTDASIGNGVTSIGASAFTSTGLTSITIPNNVTIVGDSAFQGCKLTIIRVGDGLTSIGNSAFQGCTSLTNVTIGNGFLSVGVSAFQGCGSLTQVTIGKNLVSLGSTAFADCTNLTGVYFQGNAPIADSTVFNNDNVSIIYYLPGTTGWSTPFAGRPAVSIHMQIQVGDASFGVRTNQFGFNINGSFGLTVVVEATTNLAHPSWFPLGTNTLSGSSVYFSDPKWTNYPNRFYRIRWP